MRQKYKIWIEFKNTDGTLAITDVLDHHITMGYLDVFTDNGKEIIDYHLDMSDIKYWAVYRKYRED